MIPSNNAIPDTGLSNDRDSCFCKGGDIPVDGSDADSKFFSNFLGTGYSASLQMDQNCDEAIDTIH